MVDRLVVISPTWADRIGLSDAEGPRGDVYPSVQALCAQVGGWAWDECTQWWIEQSPVHDASDAWLALSERLGLRARVVFWGVLWCGDMHALREPLERCLVLGARGLQELDPERSLDRLRMEGWWHVRAREVAFQRGLMVTPDAAQTRGLIHDLNAVLVAARAHLDFAHVRGALESQAHENATQAFRLGHELVHTIRSVFTDRVDSAVDVRLDDQLRSVVNALRLEDREGLEFVLGEGSGLVVHVNPTHLKRVVWNVLCNALEALEGVEDAAVGVHVERLSDDQALLCIEDNGRGVDPSVAAAMFEGGVSSKGEGRGHGLEVVRTLVEGWGGQVWCERSSRGGAKFCMTLVVSAQTPEPVAFPTTALASLVALDGARVMIVEDDPVLVEVYTEVLEAAGVRVGCSARADDALKRLSSEAWDVCIVDQTLVGESGVWLIEEMARAGLHVPTVLCSGFEREAFEEVLRTHPHVEFVQKPIAPTELMGCIALHLSA